MKGLNIKVIVILMVMMIVLTVGCEEISAGVSDEVESTVVESTVEEWAVIDPITPSVEESTQAVNPYVIEPKPHEYWLSEDLEDKTIAEYLFDASPTELVGVSNNEFADWVIKLGKEDILNSDIMYTAMVSDTMFGADCSVAASDGIFYMDLYQSSWYLSNIPSICIYLHYDGENKIDFGKPTFRTIYSSDEDEEEQTVSSSFDYPQEIDYNEDTVQIDTYLMSSEPAEQRVIDFLFMGRLYQYAYNTGMFSYEDCENLVDYNKYKLYKFMSIITPTEKAKTDAYMSGYDNYQIIEISVIPMTDLQYFAFMACNGYDAFNNYYITDEDIETSQNYVKEVYQERSVSSYRAGYDNTEFLFIKDSFAYDRIKAAALILEQWHGYDMFTGQSIPLEEIDDWYKDMFGYIRSEIEDEPEVLLYE